MSTVTQVVDRLYREYLEPPAALSGAFSFLSSNISAGATSFVYDAGLFDVEVESRLGAGAVVEIDKELFIATAVDTGTRTLTVKYAQLGTSQAAHTAGARIIAWPEVSRQEVTDAVYDAVPRLWPTLWGKTTVPITTGGGWNEVPAAVTKIDKATLLSGGRWHVINDTELLVDFPPSSTGKAVQWPDSVPSGLGGYLTYRNRPTRPTTDADELTGAGTLANGTVFNLRAEWEPALILDAAAAIVGKLEPDSATLRFLSEQLKARNIEAGTATAVARALKRQRDELLEELGVAWRMEQSTDVEVHRTL